MGVKVIFELANAHGGSVKTLRKTVQMCKDFEQENSAIKFQVFAPESIALPDFQWYTVYEKLYIPPKTWAEIIADAAKSLDVWIDVFDVYATEIIKASKDDVKGIKLQASVLDNLEVFDALKVIGLCGIDLMINVAGYNLAEIKEKIDRFSLLRPSNLIIQLGYQDYPTQIQDTGLQKISTIRSTFPEYQICFADHLPHESEFSKIVPSLAVIAGCSMIEKHVCIDRSQAEYDFCSALESEEIKEMLRLIEMTEESVAGEFVCEAELHYLDKSYQAPVAREYLPVGSLVSIEDVKFRRTDQKRGLKLEQIHKLQSRNRHVISKGIEKDTVIRADAFKSAKIGVIVACRMKSSRLPRKALAKINGVTSVERCLQNCLMIEEADDVILATSTVQEDSILEKHTLFGQVEFWKGDPDDVIQRYLGACDKFKIDVIIRVTADCPVLSPEIASILLDEHFASGADYTASSKCSVGTGCEIYNTEALRRVIKLTGGAPYSEYMTWYMVNNPEIFKVNKVQLPSELVRDYRLTLDHPEDLEMFEALYLELEKKGLSTEIKNVFRILDENSRIAGMNSNVELAYLTDRTLIDHLNSVTKITL